MVRKLRGGRAASRGTKGERTRAAIVAEASELFNLRGVDGVSIADILERTGLEKGGLYNHFASKDELALAAFDHAADLFEAHHLAAQARAETAAAGLRALIDGFVTMATQPFLRGGCPLLNTAVGTADTHPKVRARARARVARVLDLVASLVRQGIARGEFRADADPGAVATQFLASLEGAVMLARLYGDLAHFARVRAMLEREIAWLSA